ncbi:MAG: Gfo/Idh/MocA family oxidoreductase [Pseudomonadota bacterium]
MISANTLRLGIVGLGNIAGQHLDYLQAGEVAGCEVTALSSRTAPATAPLPHFVDYRELIASGLCDAVLVATPTFTHYEIGAAVLDAGLHLMMEKPLGLSVAEGESLLARQGDGQVFALMLNQRSDPLFLRMRDVLQAEELGNITRTHWTMTNWFRPEIYFQVSDWRATWRGEGGGLLVNQCIHNLDIFQWLCGMPEEVQAWCEFGKYHDIEVEDEATAYLRYASGATGLFVGSTGEAPGVNRLDIIGDRGSLHYDGERLVNIRNTPGTVEYSRRTRDMFGMPASEPVDITPERNINQHAAVMRNFVAAISGREDLIAPASDGLDSLALANAMLLSTWVSAPVGLPLDSQRYQAALEQRLAASTLREKADIEAKVDMSQSYR